MLVQPIEDESWEADDPEKDKGKADRDCHLRVISRPALHRHVSLEIRETIVELDTVEEREAHV